MLRFPSLTRQKSDKLCVGALNVTKCILIFLCLSACTPASIYYDQSFNPPIYFGTHVVERGETLYSIAWRYGRDFKELASANSISSPYLIQVGQRINLERVDIPPTLARKKAQNVPMQKQNVTTRNPSVQNINKNTKKKKTNNSNNITWGWPHLGLILAKYSVRNRTRIVNKGLDIGGSEGDTVRAAAAGEVVYAGNGLLGYGNLIIINHSDQYLSAYGHNKAILVREGQKVTLGQAIAKMGRNGLKPMLHFEIRKEGQPVNPEHYLPHR